ncbi:MAG: CoA transferase [Candidatus Bathyarchaeia archaeon]|nr:CoA transferase [Candidatus Bathyarchaeota archaeon]
MKSLRNLKRKSAPLFAPSHGPLSGIRVLSAGSIVAGPFIGILLADCGAELIHIEGTDGEAWRYVGPFIEGDGRRIGSEYASSVRNRLHIALNLRTEEGKEIFYGLINQSDIFIENMVWLEERFGISDEQILSVNPKIVIVHVSGYGKAKFGGDPEKCSRASYDLIAQAYSGWNKAFMAPSDDVIRIPFYTGDYITALFGAVGALAAYIHAQKTGEGQVVDVAQFEAIARILEFYYTLYFNLDGYMDWRGYEKTHPRTQPYGLYRAKDGWIALGAVGPAVYRRFIEALSGLTGINPDDFPYEECQVRDSPKGSQLYKIITECFAKYTKEELENYFAKWRIPCSRVTTPEDIIKDSHWLQRGDIIEVFEMVTGRTIKQMGVVPKFSKTPGRVWRGPTRIGEDTVKILKGLLELSDEEIMELKNKGVINFP